MKCDRTKGLRVSSLVLTLLLSLSLIINAPLTTLALEDDPASDIAVAELEEQYDQEEITDSEAESSLPQVAAAQDEPDDEVVVQTQDTTSVVATDSDEGTTDGNSGNSGTTDPNAGLRSGGPASEQKDIASASIDVAGGLIYSGQPLTPQVTVTFDGAALTEDVDYIVTFADDHTNAGTATLTITGMGNYTGSVEKNFIIAPASLSSATVANINNQTYTGEAITQSPTVGLGGTTLAEGVDYTVAYANNTKAGTATLTITGMGNYTGRVAKNFTIAPASLSSAAVANINNKTYTGEAITQSPTVGLGGTTLAEGVDYTVAYANNTKAGTATLTITGKGNYAGSVEKNFTIAPASLSSAAVANINNKTYTGEAITQSPTVKLGGTTLKAGTDYAVSYKRNKNAGTATITITGKGNYTGSVEKNFTIARASLGKAKVSGLKSKTYTGKAIKQSPTVKLGGTTLKAGTDYAVSYKRNKNAGTATITITGKGNYTGSVKKTFKITKRDFSSAKVAKIAKQLYTGKAIKPAPVVKWGNKKLKKGTDYTVTYKNNQALGTATVTITGKGNYTSKTKTLTFDIYQQAISGVKIASIPEESYTGSAIKPNPTIKFGGKTLKKGVDYTVSYSNNVYGGTATMTITGKRGFTGSRTVSFHIDGPKYYGVTVYVTDTGAKYHRSGCRWLLSKHAMDKGVAIWEGYEPCKVCRP